MIADNRLMRPNSLRWFSKYGPMNIDAEKEGRTPIGVLSLSAFACPMKVFYPQGLIKIDGDGENAVWEVNHHC